ncbi:aTP-dependent Clp protease proteolytic subunit [Mycoplasma sp. CAG:877]|nr:aTP-dependent Clp protease proteolytic subunit [Mycoplasma sp. CAG:877]
MKEQNDRYFQFVKVDDNLTELYIYGDIRKPSLIERWLEIEDDTRVDAYSFKDALNEVNTPNLLVRINSMGGSVSEGLAIYGLLSDFNGHLITQVDGFACSAASVIFMSGQERIMPENGLLMIHNAWTDACGDPNELRKAADDLEIITKPSVNIYVNKTGLSEEEIKNMMDKETWMDYKSAFEKGFATSIQKNDTIQQSIKDINSYIRNLVIKNQELTTKLEKFEKENNNAKIKEDSWESFFNL